MSKYSGLLGNADSSESTMQSEWALTRISRNQICLALKLKVSDKYRKRIHPGLSHLSSLLNIYLLEKQSTKKFAQWTGNKPYRLQDLFINKTKIKPFELLLGMIWTTRVVSVSSDKQYGFKAVFFKLGTFKICEQDMWALTGNSGSWRSIYLKGAKFEKHHFKGTAKTRRETQRFD